MDDIDLEIIRRLEQAGRPIMASDLKYVFRPSVVRPRLVRLADFGLIEKVTEAGVNYFKALNNDQNQCSPSSGLALPPPSG